MPPRSAVRLVCLALVLANPLYARPPRVLSWIVRMQSALHRRTYEGHYVFVDPPVVVAFSIRHGPGWEEVTTLNGARRTVLRAGRWTAVKSFPGPWVRLGGPPWYTDLPPRAHASLLRRLARYYRLQRVGYGRVAGERAALVVAVPRDGYRYGYRFWIAVRSLLPLRTVLVSPAGRVLEQMMFVNVSFPARLNPPRLVQWRRRRRARRRHRAFPGSLSILPECRPLWLPPGFRVMSDEVIPEGLRREPARHLLVSDGLGSFSIFVRRILAGAPPPLLGANSLGPINAYGRVVGDFAITVVGAVPPVTVRATAEHIALLMPATP